MLVHSGVIGVERAVALSGGEATRRAPDRAASSPNPYVGQRVWLRTKGLSLIMYCTSVNLRPSSVKKSMPPGGTRF